MINPELLSFEWSNIWCEFDLVPCCLQAESDRLVGGLFEEAPEHQVISTGVSMVNPDLGFINLLRYGMLALRLLPQSSLSSKYAPVVPTNWIDQNCV